MFAMSCGVYKDYTKVPLWKVEGESHPDLGGDDADEEVERDEAAAVGAGADAVRVDAQPADDKQPVKMGGRLGSNSGNV